MSELYNLKQWFDHLLSLCQTKITGFGRRGNKMVQTKIRTVDAHSDWRRRLIDNNTFAENERRETNNLYGKQVDWNITNVRL